MNGRVTTFPHGDPPARFQIASAAADRVAVEILGRAAAARARAGAVHFTILADTGAAATLGGTGIALIVADGH